MVQTYFQVIPGRQDSPESSANPLNCSRTLKSVANKAAKRRVQPGTHSARDTPTISAGSTVVAAVPLNARWADAARGRCRHPSHLSTGRE